MKKHTCCFMTIRAFALWLLLLFHLNLGAQTNGYEINVYQKQANLVLIQLQKQYQFQISFNDFQLRKYSVSCKGTYQTVEELLKNVFVNLPFNIEKQGDVFIIFYDDTKNPSSILSTILFDASIIDSETGEALPYCTVQINGEYKISDVNGRFSFVAFVEELLQLKISHLGYEQYDTLIIAMPNFNCQLQPEPNILSEATIQGNYREFGFQTGTSMGQSRVNPKMGSYITGVKSNEIDALVKMQSGIQSSSGTNNLAIWGSMPGQNQILFDGMSIYTYPQSSPFQFPVNAYMVKDIIINKGALGANYGDRVGGIVELTGVDGNRFKKEGRASFDGMGANVMISTPINDRSSIVVAGRHSWFPGYKQVFDDESSLMNVDDIDAWMPLDGDCSDLNLKYSGSNTKGDQYFVSLYGSKLKRADDFEFDNNHNYEEIEDRHHLGASFFYGKIWDNGVNSNLRFATSHSESNMEINKFDLIDEYSTQKKEVIDYKINLDNRFSVSTKQFVEAGVSAQFYQTHVVIPTTDTLFDMSSGMFQSTAYVRNHIYASKALLFDIGLRIDYQRNVNHPFFFPRIKGSLAITKTSNIYFSWGVYNQYLTCVQVIDSLKNYHYAWKGYNNEGDFLQSNVVAGGWSYSKWGWFLSTEFYSKSVEGVERFRYDVNHYLKEKGRVVTNGVDFLLKKELGKHLFWQTYTFNDSKGLFDNIASYQPTGFFRKHELNTIVMFNFHPIKISASYIYGSTTAFDNSLNSIAGDYNRVDAMVSWSSKISNMYIDVGLSTYNIFNNSNASSLRIKKIRFNDGSETVVGQGGMPCYSTLFVSLKF